MNSLKTVCVYCGSQSGHAPAFVDAARVLGKSLAEHSIQLIYGGGTKGIMGEVSRAVSQNGGGVVGIIPKFLIEWESDPDALYEMGEVIVTKDMHERKHTMFERSDAFVALPGGIGTLEEIVEVMTWAQLGRHTKPMVFANVNGFWDPMLTLLDHMRDEGFLHSLDKVKPLVVDDTAKIVDLIVNQISEMENGYKGEEKIIDKM